MIVNKLTLKIWEIPGNKQGVFNHTMGPCPLRLFDPLKLPSLHGTSLSESIGYSVVLSPSVCLSRSGRRAVNQSTCPTPRQTAANQMLSLQFYSWAMNDKRTENVWISFKGAPGRPVLPCLPFFPSWVLLAFPSVPWAKLNQCYSLQAEKSNRGQLKGIIRREEWMPITSVHHSDKFLLCWQESE